MEFQLEKIYESPFATVYKKFDSGQVFTIKVLKSDFSNPRQIIQFNNYHSILNELDIPGILKVISKGIHEGSPSITSSYFEGITLREYFKKYPFDLKARLHLASRIARILGLLHQQQIIHRDLTS